MFLKTLHLCQDVIALFFSGMQHCSKVHANNAGPLPLSEVLGIAVDILEGLAQLHDAHILHLDLKPGNVLLDKYGHAYLSDFGISFALRTLEACTSVTGASGTPHYM